MQSTLTAVWRDVQCASPNRGTVWEAEMHIVAALDAWNHTHPERLWQLSVDAGPATDRLAATVRVGPVCVLVTVHAGGAVAVTVRRPTQDDLDVWHTDGPDHDA